MLAGVLLLPLAACATKSDVRDLQEEIREMNARQEALVRELQAEQASQRDSIRAVSGQLQEHGTRMARTLDGVEEQLIRVLEYTGMSQQELAALRDQMERRAAPEPDASRGGTERGGEAEEIFDLAMTQYRRDALQSARIAFEEVVDRFPNHELTPDARYHLAEILLERGEEEEALEAFLRIPEFHPDADRVPDALYRAGMIHKERGENDEARSYLQRVVNTWPESDAAERAEQALRDIG